MIPVSLVPVSSKKLSWLDKVAYGQLRFEAGNSDRCRVVLAGIAARMGISEDSIARSIERLVKAGLVYRRRLRYESLIVFLRSSLLDGSFPRSQRSESAELRTLEGVTGVSESATLRSVENPDSATLRFQSPQLCGPESATLRSVSIKGFLEDKENTSPGAKAAPEKKTSSKAAKRTIGDPAVVAWFDTEFWPIYPRKEDRGDALKAALKLQATAADRSAILAKLNADLPDYLSREKKFIPLPASWLNKRRWLDDPPELLTAKPNGAGALPAGVDQSLLSTLPTFKKPDWMTE
jgi:hypothetical protein